MKTFFKNVSFLFNWGDSCQYPTILLQYLVILGDTSQYFYNIPNNTKQYLIDLVSVGIAWYHQSIKKCCKKIPVSSWYHHGMVLTVFCLSGIVTVPILAIFTKPLMLTCSITYDCN
jgi:hypothetical protein